MAAIAVAFGFLILRRRGVYFSLLTLALAAMLYAVAFRWTDVTGGENGLGGITRPTLFGFNLESSTDYYWFVAAIAFAVLVLLWRFHNSTVGTVLVAIRENEQRARFLGYPTNRYKLAAFVLSAGITGLAGILLLFKNRMTSADPISVAFSGDLLAMVVIGGMRSFLGPALGALFFILFREFLGIYTENWLFWFGLVFVGFIVFSPTGLVGVGERLIAPFRKKTTEDAAMSARRIEAAAAAGIPAAEIAMSTGPVLSARHIVKSFGGIKAVQGIDISIADRTLHALIGPNGAGKTTAFNLLSGMFPPDEGTVSLLGQPIAGHDAGGDRRAPASAARSRSPTCFRRSASARISASPCRRGIRSASIPLTNALSIEAINAETDATIRYLGLAGIEKAEAGMLSYGGQRLLDMGVALATAPRVLLLDEPLAGLAAAERERIGAIIKRISSRPAGAAGRARHRPGVSARRPCHRHERRPGAARRHGRGSARQPRRCRKSISAPAPPRSPRKPRETAARVSALLTAGNVDTFYGKSHILNDVNFTLHENEIIALLGRNGAGKSTLLKTLIGIAPASNGSIKLADNELIGNSSAQNARLGIGYVPQGRGLFAGMSVEQNLELGGLKRQTGNGVHWTRERIYEYFPRHSRAARQPGGLPLRRRAADGGGGPRAVGRRAGVAARRTLRGPRADRGGAIVRDLRPAAQGNRHHHRRSPSRSGAGAVRYHGGAGARPGDSSGAVEGAARRSRSAPQGAVAVRRFVRSRNDRY